MRSRSHMGIFFSLALLGSALLHFVLLRVLPAHAASLAEHESSGNSVNFDIIEPPPPPITRQPRPEEEPPRATPTPPAPPKLTPAPQRSPRKPTRTRASAADSRESTATAPEPIQAPAPSVSPPSTPPPTAAESSPAAAAQDDAVNIPPGLNLDARTAALSTWRPEAMPPSAAPPPQRSVADIEREASLTLNERLKPKATKRDEAIELKCDATQRCEFHGEALDAVIHPDGSFKIHEKLNIPLPMLNAGMLGGGGPAGLPKPEDAQAAREMNLATRKQHSVAAERARFLRETETLRRERADAWVKQNEAEGAHNFRKRLHEIWHAPALSLEQKRRQLFELWAETSQDELGEAYRKLAVEYIQRNLPEHSEVGYSTAELTSLNAGRSGQTLFAPYKP
jgi:outer membrane biosynthesis protein TonB